MSGWLNIPQIILSKAFSSENKMAWFIIPDQLWIKKTEIIFLASGLQLGHQQCCSSFFQAQGETWKRARLSRYRRNWKTNADEPLHSHMNSRSNYKWLTSCLNRCSGKIWVLQFFLNMSEKTSLSGKWKGGHRSGNRVRLWKTLLNRSEMPSSTVLKSSNPNHSVIPLQNWWITPQSWQASQPLKSVRMTEVLKRCR